MEGEREETSDRRKRQRVEGRRGKGRGVCAYEE